MTVLAVIIFCKDVILSTLQMSSKCHNHRFDKKKNPMAPQGRSIEHTQTQRHAHKDKNTLKRMQLTIASSVR